MSEEKLNKLEIRKIMSVAFMISFAVILVNVYLLHYITKLESLCDCSKDWKRTFIKYSLSLNIAVLLINLFSINLGLFKNLLIGINGLIGTVSIIIIFLYIKQLKAIKCGCSENNARLLMEVINYFKLAMLLFVAISGAGLVAAILSTK